ncbi:glucose-6-phosphate dehydrogenase (NADP(+)) [Candidatus Dependentiae bacterium]|nr:MAG: glucose-6-phosphate dehydrogenase (NADP(+)) [Candidatus Dependentiae bacterium]
MSQHTSFIIFGITGDLAKRKIMPALYHLIQTDVLTNVSFIGIGHQQSSIDTILENAKQYTEYVDENAWQHFTTLFSYIACDITNKQDMSLLFEHITTNESAYNQPSNRLFYFAVASTLFAQATKLLYEVGLCKRIASKECFWHRLVYEKPFGHDIASAHTINTTIQQYLDESQIYRIDHYLTKNIVHNITLLRFSNIMFEPLWNSTYIEEMHFVLHESIGIEKRGCFYDQYGVLKDVVQNHILQMIALIGMERPDDLQEESIRSARLNTLKHITFEDGILGQYQEYKQEFCVNKNSTTPTYALLKLHINNQRWQNTPFYVSAGKKMAESKVGIYIKFKEPHNALTQIVSTASNMLTIQLNPEAVFSLQLNVQSSSTDQKITPVEMTFCHSCLFKTRTSQPYETLLTDVYNGKITSSVRYDEIESSWHIIEHIEQKKLSLFRYDQTSLQQEETMIAFKKKHNIDFI